MSIKMINIWISRFIKYFYYFQIEEIISEKILRLISIVDKIIRIAVSILMYTYYKRCYLNKESTDYFP